MITIYILPTPSHIIADTRSKKKGGSLSPERNGTSPKSNIHIHLVEARWLIEKHHYPHKQLYYLYRILEAENR